MLRSLLLAVLLAALFPASQAMAQAPPDDWPTCTYNHGAHSEIVFGLVRDPGLSTDIQITVYDADGDTRLVVEHGSISGIGSDACLTLMNARTNRAGSGAGPNGYGLWGPRPEDRMLTFVFRETIESAGAFGTGALLFEHTFT